MPKAIVIVDYPEGFDIEQFNSLETNIEGVEVTSVYPEFSDEYMADMEEQIAQL